MEALSVISNVSTNEALLLILIGAGMVAAVAKGVWMVRKAIFTQV